MSPHTYKLPIVSERRILVRIYSGRRHLATFYRGF
jgi:hypothetical protein